MSAALNLLTNSDNSNTENFDSENFDSDSLDLDMSWDDVLASGHTDTDSFHTDNLSDALVYSLINFGRIDMEYIVTVTGSDYYTAINTLRGSIFQNPETWDECITDGWETADEYLSGNLMHKWKVAKEANETYDGYFSDNVKALEKVLPPTVAAKDIYITLGSPWVPAHIIDDFVRFLFASSYNSKHIGKFPSFKTVHDELTGTWYIPYKSALKHTITALVTYGTSSMDALTILEYTLNMKTPVVTKEVPCPINKSGVKRVIDQDETTAAIEKQTLLIQTYKKWVWSNNKRKSYLTDLYEKKFCYSRHRIYDGSFLSFPNMSDAISLRPYQKDAVARIIFSPNTLLAHDVGAGKTYVMIAAGQELRRMGLSAKNMYVVPNNIIGQWKEIFLMMYPAANLLVVEPKTFVPAARDTILKRMRDEDFDAIIIAYSCFELIPVSKNCYVNELREEKKLLEDRISELDSKCLRVPSKLERRLKKISKDLSALILDDGLEKSSIYFDELGVTRMFVDEAHNFKNIPIDSNTNMVLGINKTGSKRCEAMLRKVHFIQRSNGGKGVVFATGTPITNSVTDIYVMQRYLQGGELTMLDLQCFDSWIGMFAEKVTDFEIDVDTSTYRLATRFAKFHNLPELTAILSSIADFHQMDEASGIPQIDGYTDVLIPKTAEFAAYLQDISNRADSVRHRRVSPKIDNMLTITTDGRKAALDMRLVKPELPGNTISKICICAQKVAEIYYSTADNKSTQLIFCDTSTPKEGFNIYDELRATLIKHRIPDSQIAYIHDATTELKRQQLFSKVRAGELRILIGSTFKLGLGVNVQDRLIALHHIDVPWRPADMTQREGRILRQGNQNPKAYIYRYITEGSFDAYSWQLLETKQRFINALLEGSLTQRNASDIENTVLNYAEVKALAIGNSLVKERVKVANEISRLSTLQKQLIDSRVRMEKELLELPGLIAHQQDIIANCLLDMEYLSDTADENISAPDIKSQKERADRRRLLKQTISDALHEHVFETKDVSITTYRGFEIIVPAYMTKEKRSLRLKRLAKYTVELGDSDKGALIRIDNFLDNINEHIKKQKEVLAKLMDKKADIENELKKNESHEADITALKERLDKIDDELGVPKNEGN